MELRFNAFYPVIADVAKESVPYLFFIYGLRNPTCSVLIRIRKKSVFSVCCSSLCLPVKGAGRGGVSIRMKEGKKEKFYECQVLP